MDAPRTAHRRADGTIRHLSSGSRQARYAGHDPDRVSSVAALRITRQTIAQPGAFPPD